MFWVPNYERWKTHSYHPKTRHQQNQPPKKKNHKITNIYLGIKYGLKNNSTSLTWSAKKKKKRGEIKKAAHIPYTLEDWKFREITISLAIAGLQKLRIIAQGQLQHIFVQ